MGIVATKAFIRNELAEIKAASEGKSIQEVADQVQQELNLLENTTLNIAITGVSGAGKSSLVNALRGVADDDEGAARTGLLETTVNPARYPHPKFPNVVIWDLPGIGTPEFKSNEYLKRVNFSRYDFFIIVSGDRFTQHDTKLADEIWKMKMKFYFVRTKIDTGLDSERRKRGFDEKATLEMIRNYCGENLRKAGESSPKVFLISSWHPEKYDFPLLQETLMNGLDDLKREVLMMALPTCSKEVSERKKAAMESLIWKFALRSCAIGAIPVPGLSFVCDVVILVHAMERFCNVFGLDEVSLQKVADSVGQPVSELKSAIKKSPQAGEIKAEFVIDRLSRMALCASARAVESALGLIPVLGSLTGAGLSFVTTYWVLKSFLNDVMEDAENVRAKAVELGKKSSKKISVHPLGKRSTTYRCAEDKNIKTQA
ncbi:interferon-inducible GTPase 5-like [Tiliqua scincoides]|uniref:interferon-inducible GTPase 5-like n=1 Tax=Tiliqua scincoides TaxID=71010 RepID=UPI00346345CE